MLVSVHVGKNKTKPHCFSSLGLLLNLSTERNQGCPEIDSNVAENWDQIVHSRVMWRMLSHIRTQEMQESLPSAGCSEGHTDSKPCWETVIQCVCLRVLYAEGTVRWALPPLLLLLPGRLYPPASGLCPRALLVNFQLNYFWTVPAFAVFLKICYKGANMAPKRGCGLTRFHLNWIWARKKLLTHFRGEALVLVSLPPSGEWKAEDSCGCPGVTGPLRTVRRTGFPWSTGYEAFFPM